MFQYEFREMVAMLINAILAVAVITSIIYGMSIMRKIGAATSKTYTVQQVMSRNYEFNKYDDTELTADECVVAFAQYINSDVKICIQNKYASNAVLKSDGIIWSKLDFRSREKDGLTYSVDDIRLGKNNKGVANAELYFMPFKNGAGGVKEPIIYEVRLGYDDEKPSEVFNKPIEKNVAIGQVSSITFRAQ